MDTGRGSSTSTTRRSSAGSDTRITAVFTFILYTAYIGHYTVPGGPLLHLHEVHGRWGQPLPLRCGRDPPLREIPIAVCLFQSDLRSGHALHYRLRTADRPLPIRHDLHRDQEEAQLPALQEPRCQIHLSGFWGVSSDDTEPCHGAYTECLACHFDPDRGYAHSSLAP